MPAVRAARHRRGKITARRLRPEAVVVDPGRHLVRRRQPRPPPSVALARRLLNGHSRRIATSPVAAPAPLILHGTSDDVILRVLPCLVVAGMPIAMLCD